MVLSLHSDKSSIGPESIMAVVRGQKKRDDNMTALDPVIIQNMKSTVHVLVIVHIIAIVSLGLLKFMAALCGINLIATMVRISLDHDQRNDMAW